MPPRNKTPATPSTASGPKRFNFKVVKRSNGGSNGGEDQKMGRAHGARESRPTSTRVQKCKYQSGDKEGQETGNVMFIFNPRYGLNEQAKEKVKAHAYGKDEVGPFSKALDGFHIKVHAPKQATRMHTSLRELDAALPEALNLGSWKEPEITAATLTNLNLPGKEGVTATMLEGYTYPLYKKLRPLGYEFVKGVHGMDGVNRWVRVHEDKEDTAKWQGELQAMLEEEGWRVEFAVGDAAEWGEDE